VRRTASPTYADFGGLSSLAALVIVRLDVVPLQPLSPRRQWRVVCWADNLLDVISRVENTMREGCPGTMTGVSQCLFSGHFRQVFSTPMHYPALTLTQTCGANRVCPVLVCRGRYGFLGGVLLFILGSNLDGVGPERGLGGGGRRGWCEEWARIG
jgi:hypothetical protein